jgi:RNA-binding protein 16
VVTWSAGNSGGKAISSYTVVSSDGPSYPNSTSPKTISETGGTTQSYTIYAINANGTSAGETTNSVTTTAPFFPPFFPYFPPFFPYFPPFFPFFPYFPPFFPYFPPFFPFFPYFPPFFPYFPPYFPFFPFFPPAFGPYFTRCVDGDTLVLTSEGLKPARNIKVGDKLLTVDALGLSDQPNATPLEINVQDLMVTNLVPTEVTNVIASDKQDRVYFNGNSEAQFTETHPIFVKRNNEYRVVEAGTVQKGDILIKINIDALKETLVMSEVISEIEVTELNRVTLDVAKDVYTFSCDSYNWYFAGNILTHNK